MWIRTDTIRRDSGRFETLWMSKELWPQAMEKK